MKLALSLNTINLIITGVMSAGVVGVAAATVIGNDNSESEIVGIEEKNDELKNIDKEDEDKHSSDNTEDKNTDEKPATQQNTMANPTDSKSSLDIQNPNVSVTQPQTSGPVECRCNYASQILGIGPSTDAELMTWQGLTVNIFDQFHLHGSFYSPVRPEHLGINMGDYGGSYHFTDGWIGTYSGYTFVADINSLTVGWDIIVNPDGSSHHVALNNSAKYQLNAMTSQMTVYLRELYSQFNTKCSSFISTLPQ